MTPEAESLATPVRPVRGNWRSALLSGAGVFVVQAQILLASAYALIASAE